MFGKRKSSNDKFIMAQGRAVGNIKKVTSPAKPGTGKQHTPHTNFGHAKGVHGVVKDMGGARYNSKPVPMGKTFVANRKSAGKMEVEE